MKGSGIRVYYIVISVSCSLYFCGMLAVAVVQRIVTLVRTGTWAVAEVGGYQTGLTEKESVVLLLMLDRKPAKEVLDCNMSSSSVDGVI
jgi:hypothetical protein